MPTLLHLDSSPAGPHSITRRLTAEFAARWKQAHPDGTVIRRDLTESGIALIDGAWIQAAYTPPAQLTPDQRALLAQSEELLAELEQADQWVLGVPMHNFAVPTVVRLWIDQIARVGRTFAYVDGKPQGLLKNKEATVITASGGVYAAGSPVASFDHVTPYLRSVLGFLGVTDVRFLAAGGAAAIRSGQVTPENFLAPHIASIHAEFAAAA